VKLHRLVILIVIVLMVFSVLFFLTKMPVSTHVETVSYEWSYRGFSVGYLLAEREGFGRSVTGGLGGKVYHVTTLAESGPGSLRDAAESSEPLWIVFDVNGTINLSKPINVKSHKTIDGRGAQITISGYGFSINGASNVIIVNLRFDTAKEPGIDAIEIRGSNNVWIHHCDITNYSDGGIDIVRQSTNITISWCRFWNHDKVMLIGNDPSATADEVICVTLHHNFFFRTVQRNPRLRFGKVDVYNNYYYGWQASAAIAVAMHGQILLEANIIEAEDRKTFISSTAGSDPEEGYIKMINNLLLNGAVAKENKPEKVFRREDYYTANIEPASEALKERIMAFAGVDFPAEARIMKDHKLIMEDFRWKEIMGDPINVGVSIKLYAIVPPYRSPSEKAVIYEWNFGDGNIIETKSFSISYVYSSPGNYTLKVSLKDQNGVLLKTIYANARVISSSSNGLNSSSSTADRDIGSENNFFILISVILLFIAVTAIFMASSRRKYWFSNPRSRT